MPILSDFCFYCSLRLGSIVAGSLSFVQAVIPLCVLLSTGAENLREEAIYIHDHITEYHKQEHFEMLIKYVKKDADQFLLILIAFLSIHSVTCCIEIFGAFKLNKWLLLPYILLELIRLIILFIVHVISMIILKKKFNLGTLIGVTVAGAFGLLLLFYIWSCVVALYQVIIIINSSNYKALYGDGRTKPTKNEKNKRVMGGGIENVIIYPTPDFSQESPPMKIDRKYNSITSMQDSLIMSDFKDVQRSSRPDFRNRGYF